MKRFKNIFAALLAAFVAAALVPLASCSNSSDSASGLGVALVSTETLAVYKGTFYVAGKTFTSIAFTEDNYTMTGTGISDIGTWTRASSSARSLIANGGSYYMQSNSMTNASGDKAKWGLTITEKTSEGNSITLSSLSSSSTGYVSASGTGAYAKSDGTTYNGGGSSTGGGSGTGGDSGTLQPTSIENAIKIAQSKFGVTGNYTAKYNSAADSSTGIKTTTNYVTTYSGGKVIYIIASDWPASGAQKAYTDYKCYYGSYTTENVAEPTIYNNAEVFWHIRPSQELYMESGGPTIKEPTTTYDKWLVGLKYDSSTQTQKIVWSSQDF